MSTLGLMLVLVGAALVVAEAHVPSHGVLGSGAVIALAAGVALAVSGAGIAFGVALACGLVVGIVGAIWLWVMVRKALAARRIRVRNELVGRVGVVRAVPQPMGQVFVDGALWRARLWGLDGNERQLAAGDPVVVERIDGLTLTVRPAEEWEVAP